jgi:hypothetical protein
VPEVRLNRTACYVRRLRQLSAPLSAPLYEKANGPTRSCRPLTKEEKEIAVRLIASEELALATARGEAIRRSRRDMGQSVGLTQPQIDAERLAEDLAFRNAKGQQDHIARRDAGQPTGQSQGQIDTERASEAATFATNKGTFDAQARRDSLLDTWHT